MGRNNSRYLEKVFCGNSNDRICNMMFGIAFIRRSTVGVGVNFVDVLDCWEFKNTNFKFSYIYMQNFLPSTSLGKYRPIDLKF